MITFSIAHLCDEFGVTLRALRFYEERGLLSPTRLGSTSERVYSQRDRTRLLLILRGKRFGFSLAEIKEMLDLYDLPNGRVEQLSHIIPKFRSQLAELQKEHAQLELTIEELASTCAVVEGAFSGEAVLCQSPANAWSENSTSNS